MRFRMRRFIKHAGSAANSLRTNREQSAQRAEKLPKSGFLANRTYARHNKTCNNGVCADLNKLEQRLT